MSARVLVTGGAGYIGAHVVLALARAGYAPVIADNLANSSASVQPRLSRLAGVDIPLHVADVRDRRALDRLFGSQSIDAVVHCAGLKAVADSEAQPLVYYDNNVCGSITLLRAMEESGVRTLVFSSSASVYGQPDGNPVSEDAAVRPANVYGRTKRAIELILGEAARRDGSWRIALLRYFNPAGADASGEIGEAPSGSPNNLVPIIAEVVLGRRPRLEVFGDDYPTPDGTGVRDYIHVSDLAAGHVAALRYLGDASAGALTLNLGLGHGSSVREVLAAFERACGRRIPWSVVPRRPGDVACYYADPARANALLGWRARRHLDEICADAWRWASRSSELQRTRKLTSTGL
ncbi:MAG TPA: UDP-glucose 4-epimerase GalE [Casimicrobiaceae bacterium]|nr:UDP-glucose 4-epimerase GalE [Casimicrobiaceae bacterium]